MEVTKAIKFESMGCTECINLALDTLHNMNGVLMIMVRSNELILTYDDARITFSDLINMVLMHGLALYLRKIVLRMTNTHELDQEELRVLFRKFNDLVSINQDVTTHRIYIIMHPDLNPDPVIKELRKLGVQVSEPLIDEISQIRISMS